MVSPRRNTARVYSIFGAFELAFNIEGTHQTYYIEKTEALLMR